MIVVDDVLAVEDKGLGAVVVVLVTISLVAPFLVEEVDVGLVSV